jgi:hypothetical protein
VGRERFIKEIKQKLGVRAITREVTEADDDSSYILRESEDSYKGILRGKKKLLSNKVQLRNFAIDL